MLPSPKRAPHDRPPERPDLRAIFEQECSYVWNTLRYLGVAASDLEDLTHDVFVTVHRRLADYDPERPLRPWLFGIALRTALRFRKLARHRREVLPGELEQVDSGPTADAQLETAEAQRLVQRGLLLLSEPHRAVFVMAELHGQAVPEIAEALELPLNTAYSRLRRAREQFRAAIQRLQAEQERP